MAFCDGRMPVNAPRDMNPGRPSISVSSGRTFGTLVLWVVGLAMASANTAQVRLSSFPSLTVADGRSTVTITADIRDQAGRKVPDGTQVVFTTTLGSFRDPVVRTNGGLARGVLVASSIPGVAKITASALAFNSTSTLDFEFVADRQLLSSATEFIEVVGPRQVVYCTELRVLAASGLNRGVKLRFRDIEIEADDLQVQVPATIVRARKARLKIGQVDQQFDELYFRLNQRQGFGTTTFVDKRTVIRHNGWFAAPIEEERERYGLAEVRTNGLAAPSSPLPPDAFDFEDLTDSPTLIAAKKAVAFPRREVQFHQAEILVGGARAMRIPLFQVSLFGQSPILTDQIVNVYDNQLSVNYPHFLSLKPGMTSLLRFRWGERYGRSTTASSTGFVNYELNWNRGDDMEGGFVLSGIGRNDWGVGLRQYYRADERTVANVQLDLASLDSIYGSANLSRQFEGFSASLNANQARAISGQLFNSSGYSMIVERDPMKVGTLPMRLYLGLSATHTKTESRFASNEATRYGTRARMQFLPMRPDSQSTLNASFMVEALGGDTSRSGLAYTADLSLGRQLGRSGSALLTYNFNDDGFNSRLLGRHSMSIQTFLSSGRLGLSAMANQALDVERSTFLIDASYRVSDLWRLSYSYTFNRYFGDSYLDYSAMIGYRLGVREVGLIYSHRTRRIGFQVLGATFD